MALKDLLISRLRPYWKMEAANVVFVPLCMIYLSAGQIGWTSIVAAIPMMLMLIIGAAYWRIKVQKLEALARDVSPTMAIIAKVQQPVLILCIIAVLAAAAAWLWPGQAVGQADKIVASTGAALAVLEYVNYYHRQLQHFDSKADFKRLLRGRGFRPSQMARDLRDFREGR